MWAKLKQHIWEWRGVFSIAPTIAGIALALRLMGWLQPWEWAALDQYFRWRPPEPTDDRIVIVGISEADLKPVGQWPIPDTVLAQLLEKIKAQKPMAIGLDLYRDMPVEPGHSEVVNVFKTTPNLIGIEIDNKNSAIAPPPVLQEQGQVAFNNFVVDTDGKLRPGLLSMEKNGQPTPSFSFLLAGMYLEAQNILPQPTKTDPKVFQWGKAIFRPFTPHDGADNGGYQILLNYQGQPGSFRTLLLTDVLENRIPADLMRDASTGAFAGRIVLIGSTATSLNDYFYTPYSGDQITRLTRTPGVEVHANLISQILSAAVEGRPAIKTWPEVVEGFWIFLWSSVGATLCWALRDASRRFTEDVAKLLPRWTVISLLVTGGSLVGGSYLAFLVDGWWIPVVPPVLALLGSATAMTGYIANVEREDRRTVMNLFGRHVTPKIAQAIWCDRHQLLKEGRLRGRTMTATVLFTDLKGFSTTAELIDPESLMSWLNEYREVMAQVVVAHGRVVDKFIGDAIMAVFGVPIERTTEEAIASDAVASVNCALAMAQQLDILNQLLINQGTYQYVQDKFSTQQIGCVRLKEREQGTLIYQVLRSPNLKENPEGSISVSVAIALAEQRSLEKSLREDFFSTADYPFSQTEF